jgi:glycerophosphoryl diester phosphodiesterase
MREEYLKTGSYKILSAHRGGGVEKAENTTGAFQNAL